MTDGTWLPLKNTLKRWRAAGRRADFWLRDDDAVAPTPALERLLGLTEQFEIPLMLAVIPAHAVGELVSAIAERRTTTPVVHGWSHENHANAGQKKQELGLHRPAEAVLAELARGFESIAALFGERMAPVLVPPWNRIDATLIPHLKAIGFDALSTFGLPKPAPIRMINPTVDIMDWHGTRGCREPAALIDEIVSELDAGLADKRHPPVGILTHHLVHDEAAWTFLETLFNVTATGNICRWRSTRELLAA
jgi:peptidoglycan/xylan/chitin deacetylase (PgdA/CDA1 family)